MTKTPSLRERLADGKRGLGCANDVAREAQKNAALLKELVAVCSDGNGVVSHRAASAVRKVQMVRPDAVDAYASKLLRVALACNDLKTQWNLTRIVGALSLKPRERRLAVELFFNALLSPSGFLRTFGMQGLVNLAAADAALRPRVCTVVEKALNDASPAMRARARKLVKTL